MVKGGKRVVKPKCSKPVHHCPECPHGQIFSPPQSPSPSFFSFPHKASQTKNIFIISKEIGLMSCVVTGLSDHVYPTESLERYVTPEWLDFSDTSGRDFAKWFNLYTRVSKLLASTLMEECVSVCFTF